MKNIMNILPLKVATTILIASAIITGCGSSDPKNEGNHLPDVNIIETDKTVKKDTLVSLTSVAIDVDGDALTYKWSFLSTPKGTTAKLTTDTTKKSSFKADKIGVYKIKFVAKDTLSAEGSDIVTITVKKEEAVSGDNSKSLIFAFGTNTGQGTEPWISNGTTSGTKIIKDITAGRVSSQPMHFKKVGKITYFFAEEVETSALWKTDGTETGTVMVKNNLKLSTRTGNSCLKGEKGMVDMGGILYFTADDGVNGAELWRTDGTENGTYMVKDINSYADASSIITNLTKHKGKLYFSAFDGLLNNGYGLWKSDGTEAGTVLVTNLDAPNYAKTCIVSFKDYIYFNAQDKYNSNKTHYRELWRSDGTKSGTTLVKDIKTANDDNQASMLDKSGNPDNLTVVGNTLYFSVIGKELWKSDGTESGTVMVKDFSTSEKDFLPGPLNLNEVNGKLVFLVRTDFNTANEYKLWTSDGTELGTKIIQDTFISNISSFYPAGNKLYYIPYIASYGSEMWVTDGTETGTHITKDIYKGSASGMASYVFGAVDNKLLFTAKTADYMYKSEIWITDGTESGTKRVTHLQP